MRCAAQAAVIGAVGLEVLTQAMTVYLGMVSGSPSGAVFGSLFGSLLFVYVVSRLVVFIAACRRPHRRTHRQSGARGVNATCSTPPFSMIRAEPAGTSCHTPGRSTRGSDTTARASAEKWANRSLAG
jgi:hypothetical protein